ALCVYALICSYFFFQAEDGIRDRTVTGVQTCALPISGIDRAGRHRARQELLHQTTAGGAEIGRRDRQRRREIALREDLPVLRIRSEERRVGKECRCRGWRGDEQKKERPQRQGTVGGAA